ncbi:hypothetical protein CVT24_000619 [Panaeolus cyanescens]|uniref:L-rhamnose mutarotase n=1 Tax=Panaeolus cyanescens TaxID=181874 RepID=A0A409YTE7_9AGAR|nr:hypothetical protein CVT24_000619 [Panaeolus cyanescens]
MSSKRICQIIKLKPECKDEYIQIHQQTWPAVLLALQRSNIIDYSIHYAERFDLLIATFKYTGSNYAEDMARIAEDPETRRWWAITDGMQESLVSGAQGSGGDVPWWLDLPEVFRFEGGSVE